MKVLVIRPGALGDTLMLAPALSALSGRVEVTFAGRNPGLHFISPLVHRVMDMEGQGWHRLFIGGRGRKDPPPLPQAETVAAFLTDKGRVVENNLRSFFPGVAVHMFPSLPPETEKIHVARYAARCLSRAGLPVDPDSAMEMATNGTLGRKLGAWERHNRLVVHPGSGSEAKNHPERFWVDLLEALSGKEPLARLEPILLLGPAEKRLRDYFKESLRHRGVGIIPCQDSETLIHTLGRAALYLGHDSGVTHLAAMLGVPTVALFRGTDPAQWAPLGPHVAVIQQEKPNRALILRIVETSADLMEGSGSRSGV